MSLFSNFFSKLRSKIGADKDLKEIARGGLTAFIVNLAGLGVGYLFVFLISVIYKTSTAEIYGEYIIVTLFIRVGSIITRFGTDTTMLQLTAAFSSEKLWGNILQVNKRLLGLLLLIGTIVTVVSIGLCKPLGILLKLSSKSVVISSVFIIPMALGLYYSQSLRGLKRIGMSTFLRSSALPILNFILLPLFLVFVHKNSKEFSELPEYTFFLSTIITVVIGYIYWNKASSASGQGELLYDEKHNKSTKELFYKSYPLLLAESAIFIGTWVDQLLLGILGNTADVGIFNICVKYAMVASLSLQAVNTISAAKFSEYYFKGDYVSLSQNVQKTTKTIFFTTLPIVIIYLLFPKFLLSIFGAEFATGWIAFMILTFGALVNVFTGSVGVLLQMTGHQKTVQNILLGVITIQIILNLLLIPRYGVTGAAIATTFCWCLQNFTMVFYVKKYFGFSSLPNLLG